MRFGWIPFLGVATVLALSLGRCGATSSSGSGVCSLTENTTATAVVNEYGCAVLKRDTSSCKAAREAQGLTGFWLNFSCRVTLTKSGANVTLTSDNRPDSKSPYFASTDGCYEANSASGRTMNPNTLAEKTIAMTVPFAPATLGSPVTMDGATVGMTVNGVSVFGNFAAPGDDIYNEVQSFDKCEGHPQNSGVYHYHAEAPSISYKDTGFVGVMRDGFPIYGRYHTGTTEPVDLDTAGGHTATTADSATPIYHYHVNLQTSGAKSVYFLTKGKFAGTKGTCTGC